MLLGISFFFFFQAEDGIRDYKVTGVQTCALPICVPGYETYEWNAIFAPAGTPPAIVNRLSTVLAKVLREPAIVERLAGDRKSTRLNSSHLVISYAVFCLKKKIEERDQLDRVQCHARDHKHDRRIHS